MADNNALNRLPKWGEAMKDVTKERLLAALLDDSNQTMTAVAEAAKVSRKTLYNYMTEDDFVRAYQQQRQMQAVRRADMLAQQRSEAVFTIIGLMHDTSQPAHVRLKAAAQILAEADEAEKTVDEIAKSWIFTASNGF